MKRSKILGITASLGLLAAQGAQAIDLSWSGFGSGFYGQSMNSQLMPNKFTDTKANFTDFSLVGLTLNAKVADHWSAAAQFVAQGAGVNSAGAGDDYFLRTQWAYVSYNPDDKTSFKIGRQRYTVFTASEYIFQHYLLPFRDLPSVVYQTAPFNSFDGISASREIGLGNGVKMNIAVFGGTPIVDVASTTLTIGGDNMLGARVNVEGDGWRVRAQASRTHETITTIPAPGTVGTSTTFATANQNIYSVGYRYDKYNIVSWGEYIFRNAKDGNKSSYGQTFRLVKSGYILVGYRFGDLMPRYTFAQNSTSLGFSKPGTATTHTIGLNYTVSPSCVLKAEYEIANASVVGGGYSFRQAAGATKTSGGALYAGVDFAF